MNIRSRLASSILAALLPVIFVLVGCPHRVSFVGTGADSSLNSDGALPLDGGSVDDGAAGHPRSDSTPLTGGAKNSGGWTWSHPQPQGHTIHAVWATRENEIWAAGDYVLLRKDDTGWHLEELAFKAKSLWADDAHVTVVGSDGGYAFGTKTNGKWSFNQGVARAEFSTKDLIGVWGDSESGKAVIVAEDAIGRIFLDPKVKAEESVTPLHSMRPTSTDFYLSLAGHADGILIGGTSADIWRLSKSAWLTEADVGGSLVPIDHSLQLGPSTHVSSIWAIEDDKYRYTAGPQAGPFDVWVGVGEFETVPWSCRLATGSCDISFNAIWGFNSLATASGGLQEDYWIAGDDGAIYSGLAVDIEGLDAVRNFPFFVGSQDLHTVHGYNSEKDHHLWLGGARGKMVHVEYPKQAGGHERYAEAKIEESVAALSSSTIRDIWVGDTETESGVIWVVGDDALIMRLGADGEWKDFSQPKGVSADLHGIHGRSLEDLMIVGEAGTALFWNGVDFETVLDISLSSQFNFHSVARLNDGYLVVGEQSGGTAGWAAYCVVPCVSASDWKSTTGDKMPGLHGIGKDDGDGTVWVVGDQHNVQKFNESGNTLSTATLTSDALSGMDESRICWRGVASQSALDQKVLVGYTVLEGSSCSGEETTTDTEPDRGLAWHCEKTVCKTVSGGGDNGFAALYGLNNMGGWGQIWAVGEKGKAWHIDGTTAVATPHDTGTNNALRAIFVRGPKNVWVAGDGAAIIHGYE
jgi:hypothetical protein